MEAIKIGGNTSKEEVKTLINKHLSNSKISIKETDYEKRFEFLLSCGRKKMEQDITLYSKVGNLVNDIIMNIYIKDLIKNRVDKICDDYCKIEKEKITQSAYSILLNEEYFSIEKNRIMEDIVDYLMENNSIILDGFVNFRLKRFLYIIDISIERGIGTLETEKEYEEFIGMLQYFVEIQEPKAEVVNLIINKEEYYLLDKNNKKIEDNIIEDLEKDLYYEGMSKSDLIISALIVLSPLKLIVHIEEEIEEELVTVISQVFEEKVEFCRGCKVCSKKSKTKISKWLGVD